MTTVLRRWSGWTPAATLAALIGCGQPPPMVTMTPPGSGVDPLAVDVNDDAFKAKALGEVPAAKAKPAEDEGPEVEVDMETPVIEPTEPGQEVETESGLKVTTLEPGDPEGPTARVGNTIRVFYRGTLDDGTVFDSNFDKEPIEFQLRPKALIQGWVEGIPGMKVGERRKLVVPSDLGYGDRGFPPDIPPGARLTFEVELVGVR